MVVRIAGRRMYLWRAVDQEGEILDLLIHGETRVSIVAGTPTPLLGTGPSRFQPARREVLR
jgi:hypothetical protein